MWAAPCWYLQSSKAVRRIVCWWVLAFGSTAALAHGTGYEILESKNAVAIQLFYVGGEPLPYVETKVFSPADATAPFQQGRADKLGRVSFYPDRPGNWKIEARDGEGHAIRADITVANDLTTASSASTGQEAKGLRRWLFLSMLANLGLIFLVGIRVERHITKWRTARELPLK